MDSTNKSSFKSYLFCFLVLALFFICQIGFSRSSGTFMYNRTDVLVYSLPFSGLGSTGIIILLILIFLKIYNRIKNGKEKKEFWETDEYIKEHPSKLNFINKRNNFMVRFLTPASLAIIAVLMIMTAFFYRYEITASSFRKYNMFNIKTMELPLSEMTYAETGLHKESSGRSSWIIATYIKVYFNDKSYMLNEFKDYDIMKFYYTHSPHLGRGCFVIKGSEYTEEYLNTRYEWSAEHKERFRRFMEKENL